uniref:INO80 complex subunit B-like conserved region domain-containing protein n=1 Tax=Spongospora subterranea TaxID=70186 RepID=A0A0H5RMR6_9EUKA|eukprot:CRZ10019.1 hypothetical protein [Spongospora subterranea]
MSSGIRVRLRRNSSSEFTVVTNSYEIVAVHRGPPMKISLRKVDDETDPGSASESGESSNEEMGIHEDRLTNRQRSMRFADEAEDEEENEDDVDAPVFTEEAALRKSELQRRRKLAMDRVEEEAKQETIERLLKKTSVRKQRSDRNKRNRDGGFVKKSAEERRQEESQIPHPGIYRFRMFSVDNHHSQSLLTIPLGYKFPAEEAAPPRQRPKCSVETCSQPRRYTCSSNMLPVCSLSCYQRIRANPC